MRCDRMSGSCGAAPVERLGSVYSPIPYAAELETLHYPERLRIAEAVRRLA